MNLPNWLSLVKGSLDETPGEVTMLLHEPIGFNKADGSGISSRMFGESLAGIHPSKNVTIDINTLGGKVDDGLAMANMVSARGNVTTRVVGYAASMGAIIHQAGAKRIMLPGTMLVVHNPQAELGNGDYRDANQKGSFLKQVRDSLAGMLAKRSGQKIETINDMMDKTTALSPEDAKRLGFCDEIGDGIPAFGEMSPSAMFEFLKTVNGSNPEGINQYTGGDSGASADAERSSSEALKSEKVLQKDPLSTLKRKSAMEKHRFASEMHERAAGLANNPSEAQRFHNDRLSYHNDRAAKLHADLSTTNTLQLPIDMKLTLSALGKLVKLPENITDELAAPQVESSLTALLTERDNLKAQVEKDKASLLARVTNRVDKAVVAKLVKADRKDDLIAAGVTNESVLNFLDDIQLPGMGIRHGAKPVPVIEGNASDTLEDLRADLEENKGNPHATGIIVRKMQELRGKKNMFATIN